MESQIDKEHVKHAIGRGRLLLNSNISEHMANLKKVQSSEEQLNSLSESSHRLDKLLKDYADYQAGTMKYRDFYSLYSNSREIVTRKSEKVKSGATNEFIDLQNRNVLERFEPDIVANNFLKKPEYQ